MYGGIPKEELNRFNNYFKVFPNLKNDLFKKLNEKYFELKKDNIYDFIKNHKDIQNYKSKFENIFSDFGEYLYNELIDNLMVIDVHSEENKISNDIFERIDKISLLDKYKAYHYV